MDTIDIRLTAPEDARAAAKVFANALLFPDPSDEEWTTRLPSWDESDSVSAWDGEQCVGHAASFRFDTTVTGGQRLKTAGVTRIGVLPTHTRQGVLSGLMRRLLTEVRSNGTVLASLRASEAVIYGRYGFAIAGESIGFTLKPREAGGVHAASSGSVRILAADELLATVPALYNRVARLVVGTVSRPEFMWTRYLADALEKKKASFVAVHLDHDGEMDGYVHYDVSWRDTPGAPSQGLGEIHDLFGADAAVERALWAYVLGIDLIVEWSADNRPVDEAIRFAVRNSRAYQVRERWDEQWLRILDVRGALAARAFGAAAGAVVIRVTDPLFGGNNGTWSISAAGAVPSSDAADLEVDIASLSAAYLGGTSWSELARAGRIDVRSADAISTADLLFAQLPAPFCGTFF